MNPYTTGIYKNRVLNSFLPSKAFFPNNVPPKHQQWVNTEITTLLKFGVIKKWNDCPQSKISPTPLITHPLMVKEERTKNRLIYDAQFLNCFMNPPSFTMQGIPKLAQLGWANMFMTTLDHKNGYFHVPLNTNSWTYFGVYWNNMFYVYTTLCFGWSPAPFIYSTLTELIANYVRALTLALILTWIDERINQHTIPFSQLCMLHNLHGPIQSRIFRKPPKIGTHTRTNYHLPWNHNRFPPTNVLYPTNQSSKNPFSDKQNSRRKPMHP